MKKIPYLSLLFLLLAAVLSSCGEDRTHEFYDLTQENQWIYSKMKEVYLWRDNIKEQSRTTFFSKPSKFFSTILHTNDKVSYFTDTVSAGSYGMTFAIMRDPIGERPSKVYALVLMVEPGSPADIAGVERGTWISSVGGMAFTTTKYSLLQSGGNTKLVTESIDYDDDAQRYYWIPGDTLQMGASVDYTERAVYLDTIYNVRSKNIGYLVINNFNGDAFVDDTQNALLRFAANDVSDVIIDLRYCAGGSISNAVSLASSFVAPELYGSAFCNLVDISSEIDTSYCYTQQLTSLSEKRLLLITGEQTTGAAELFTKALDSSRSRYDVITFGAMTPAVNTITNSFESPFGFTINPATNYAALAEGELLSAITPDFQVDELQQFTSVQLLGSEQEYLLYNVLYYSIFSTIPAAESYSEVSLSRYQCSKPFIK